MTTRAQNPSMRGKLNIHCCFLSLDHSIQRRIPSSPGRWSSCLPCKAQTTRAEVTRILCEHVLKYLHKYFKICISLQLSGLYLLLYYPRQLWIVSNKVITIYFILSFFFLSNNPYFQSHVFPSEASNQEKAIQLIQSLVKCLS